MSEARRTPHGPRLSSLVEDYIRRSLQRGVHPALDLLKDKEDPVSVSHERRTHGGSLNTEHESGGADNKRNKLYRDIIEERERFRQAMEDYERTTAGTRFQTDVTSKPLHTWEEVLEEVDKVSRIYNSKATVWGKVRTGLHQLESNNKAFEVWADLCRREIIVQLSVEVFVIHHIFNPHKQSANPLKAAARLADLRCIISDTLTEIPVLLTCIHRALNIFEKSEELQQCSAALYIATIAVPHHIICWYKTKAIKKLSLRIVKQDSYETKLESLLQDMRNKSESLDKLAQLCSYQAIEETRKRKLNKLDGLVWKLNAIMAEFLGSHDRLYPKTKESEGGSP
ncbi:hypothetical protein TSTA_013970 [Talaromyces stipitatus ATCC 10500]|uniref:Uncharacterized protein n=1 Tax=Talaromyces stipitatus (strain ATCC 10500 / CBS 375.48 / QM 6759 / NRRL 1006) TaxID=441959 RepID=B8MGR8_TALSN|nr:uncharacterized protein TSTA_013970 [Talaromyces stipitatus ATCC 10500]EED16299.1 hypothetical protein TSTA_013970 [Talaromyces stipitatus ATCC 10500]